MSLRPRRSAVHADADRVQVDSLTGEHLQPISEVELTRCRHRREVCRCPDQVADDLGRRDDLARVVRLERASRAEGDLYRRAIAIDSDAYRGHVERDTDQLSILRDIDRCRGVTLAVRKHLNY